MTVRTETRPASRRGGGLAAFGTVLLVVAALATYAAWHTWQHPPRPDTAGVWTPIVTTVAGRGSPGFVDGDTSRAAFSDPFGVAIGPDGAVYVADAGENNRIRRIEGGRVATAAGGRFEGLSDAVAADAAFHTPSGIAAAPDGTLFVADTGNHAIRRISPDLRVVTLAGSGAPGYRDGDAVDAAFNGPTGLAVAPDGRIYVADTYNDRIRRIDPGGMVTTVAGSGLPGLLDGAATSARFDTPAGLAVESDGILLVADAGNHVLRRIDTAAGVVTTVTFTSRDGSDVSLFAPLAVATGAGGLVYVSESRGRIVQIFPDGTARLLAGSRPGHADGAGLSARLFTPSGLAVDRAGALLVADAGNYVVRRIAPPGLYPPDPPRSPLSGPAGRWMLDRGQWVLLWPIDPQGEPREVAGTMGEPRGPADNGRERFHVGLDIQADHGTPVRAVRSGKVERLLAAQSFGTLNESLSIGPLTYVHLRVGRDRDERALDPERFWPVLDELAQVTRVRVRRGARFLAGEIVGTVNRFNHVHLNTGPSGREVNPLLLGLPGFTDTIPPSIAPRGIELMNDIGQPFAVRSRGRLVISGRVRVVVEAWDRADGNKPSRRLGLFRLGYQVMRGTGGPVAGFEQPRTTIAFDRLADEPDAPSFVFAEGSGIAAYGYRRTRYRYTVTNRLQDGRAAQDVWDTRALPDGDYVLRVVTGDVAGNEALADLPVTIVNGTGEATATR